MNAKKTPIPAIWFLDDAARDSGRDSDKRLIACEKASTEAVEMTLLVDQRTAGQAGAHRGAELPGGQKDVFKRLGKAETAGSIQVLVDLEDWVEALGELLASLRDRANRRVVVHMGDARIGGAIDQRMVALGYRRLTANEGLYVFDIENYKDTPDWLSPRNWANPELWDKYRW